MMTQNELQQQALSRARGGMTTSNFMAIFTGFEAKGIAIDEIRPRDNVLTFNAWKALGRTVKKGEHGVQVQTWIPIETKAASGDDQPADGKPDGKKRKGGARPRTATVFHISQTKPMGVE